MRILSDKGVLSPPRWQRAEAGGRSRWRSRRARRALAGPGECATQRLRSCGPTLFFPLPLHLNPLSLLTLTLGSGLVLFSAFEWRRGTRLRILRVLADLLRGCLFEGAFGHPSNPGNRRLAAHKPPPPLLILVLDRVRLLERPVSRRCTLSSSCARCPSSPTATSSSIRT